MPGFAWQARQVQRAVGFSMACCYLTAADGYCCAGILQDLFLDLDVSSSADPSAGR